MPISNGKYINPGWVNGQPPAINASELNAISDTLESLDGVGGKRGGYVVVGTSTAGATVTTCDFLCDGTADDVEINAAIQQAKDVNLDLLILSGTYNITNSLTPYYNMMIQGQSTGSSDPTDVGLFFPNETILLPSNPSLKSLFLIGGARPNTRSHDSAIYLKDITCGSASSDTYRDLVFLDCSAHYNATIHLNNVILTNSIGIKMPINGFDIHALNSVIYNTDFVDFSGSIIEKCSLHSVSFSNAVGQNNFLYLNNFIGNVSLTDCQNCTFIGNVFNGDLTLNTVGGGVGRLICACNNISSNLFNASSGITLGANTYYNMITNNGGVLYSGNTSFTPWAGVTDNGSNNYVANNMPT